MKGTNFFSSGFYTNWTKTRMSGIKKYINLDILKNKTLLELGAGNGNNGNEFYNLGCKVTSSDARVKHINDGKIILGNNGFKHFVINDKILNSFIFKYDWKNKNKNNWDLGMRRFWICWNENVDEKQLFKNLEM